MNNSIKEALSLFGLSTKQVLVYQSLLNLGGSSASHIAMATDLPRQTIYSLLKDLVNMRLVEQSDKNGTRQFFADPNDLLLAIDARRSEFEKKKKEVENELPTIIERQRKARYFPKVQYYEGKDGLIRLFEHILELHRKGKDSMFRGYGINQFGQFIPKFLEDFVFRRHTYGVETHLFIAKGPDDFGINEKDRLYGRKIKHLEMPEQKAGIYLVADRVYLFSFADQVGVMIENQAIVKLLKDIFDTQWKDTSDDEEKMSGGEK